MLICPVPKEQLPINEYKEFSNSWFFSLALNKRANLFKLTFNSWLLFIPFISVLCEGSYQLSQKPIQFLFIVFLFSFIVPLFIFLRQLIGWQYIYRRLLTREVVYEETDWHDGQRWIKPLEMSDKDILIAIHQVFPIINFIKICIKISMYELGLILLIYILISRSYY